MLGKDLLLCLFISLAFGASLSWGHEELKAVIQFTRHGARPSKEFIYRNGLFSEKLDELSRLGTGTSMIVGQNMRKRYVTELKFLSSNYNRNEFQAKADSGPKIKQSAHCIIKGMYADLRLPCMPGYPDSDANKLNLVITDRNNDRLLNPTHTCKPIEQKVHFMKKDSEICRNYETPLRRTLFRQIQDKFNAVAEPSLKLAELRHLKDVAKIHDTYVTNKLHQKMIPNFSVFERQLEEVMLYFYYKIKFGDTTVKKAAVTELYTEWRDIINSAISNRSVPKLALYVGHQSQMMNILGTLWSYDELKRMPDGLPGYSAILNMEIWKSHNQYSVKLSYNGKEKFLSACRGKRCSANDFMAFLNSNIIPGFASKCQGSTPF